MKRSRVIHLVIIPTLTITLSSCGHKYTGTPQVEQAASVYSGVTPGQPYSGGGVHYIPFNLSNWSGGTYIGESAPSVRAISGSSASSAVPRAGFVSRSSVAVSRGGFGSIGHSSAS